MIIIERGSTDLNGSLEKLPVKTGNKIILMPVEEIVYFKAENNHIYLNNEKGNRYIMDLNLEELTKKLPSHFLKIHRSVIINTNKIREIQKFLNGRFELVMDDTIKSKLESSRSHSEHIKKLYQL